MLTRTWPTLPVYNTPQLRLAVEFCLLFLTLGYRIYATNTLL
jgi:hypothetical protein